MKKSFSVSNFELLSLQNIIKDGNLNLLQQLLIQGEVSLHFKDVYKNSLLHIAISYNQHDICKYLLEEGIDTNSVNIWHMTPLEQSIHMKYDKISELLREHKAYYKNKFDSEQIIFGERNLFFEKMNIMIQNLVLFFPSTVQVNFFHHNYVSDYLFCCSKHFSKNESFQRYISNFILMLGMKLFEKKEYRTECITDVNTFPFLPYCKIFEIKQLVLIPLNINRILIGYFFIWNKKPESIIQDYERLMRKIMLGQYFEILQCSLPTYRENIKYRVIKDFVQTSIQKMQQRFLNYETHVSIMKFVENMTPYWNELKEETYFKQLFFVIVYFKKILIPSHACFKLCQFNSSLYERLVQQEIISIEQNFESYPLQELKLVCFGDIFAETQKECRMSPFDYFHVIGKDVTKEQYQSLESLYDAFDETKFNFQIYFDIQKILFQRDVVRSSNVLGVQNKYEHTFFVFHDEVKSSLDFVFEKSASFECLYTRVFYLFHSICQYIHPFVDGNGRTCRLVLNFYLKKYGFEGCISRREKMISFQEFQKKVLGSKT